LPERPRSRTAFVTLGVGWTTKQTRQQTIMEGPTSGLSKGCTLGENTFANPKTVVLNLKT